MSPRTKGSAAAPKGVPESAETQRHRSPALLASMKKSRASARALLAALDTGPGEAAVLAAAAHRAHLAVAELWTLAEADLARRLR